MANKAISEKQKYALYERYSAAHLTSAADLLAWYEIVADEYGVTQSAVRGWIAQCDEMYRRALHEATATEAQRTAAIIGAGAARALQVLNEQLEATTAKVIHDRDGNVLDTLYFPDNQARKAAAAEILKVVGGYAPDQLNLNQGTTPLNNLTDDELQQELALLRKAKAAEGTGSTPGTPGA